MKRIVTLFVLVLVAASCSGSESDSTTTSAPGATSTTPVGGDGGGTTSTSLDATTSTATDGETTTTTVAETTTTVGEATTTTTSGGGSAEAVFVISRVVFGDEGYVSISNVGGAAGNLDGWQLCQRPAYFTIGPVDVAVGETVHFATGSAPDLPGQVIESNGRFGRFGPEGGEIGLYVDSSFGSASSIRSYVEWGSPDHGRSSVAVAAGIWTEGGFVPSEGVPGLAATVDFPVKPADWATS
ncbi:MAG: hypothetical protein HKN80_15400 [Acidimicrobiia bacterium]|nr:hypothetical protein [Acidimicrobiia bacterium]